jgi:hypothetical protein
MAMAFKLRSRETPIGYVVAPRSRRDVEASAAAVRRALGYDPLAALPGWRLFERVGQCAVTSSTGKKLALTYDVPPIIEGDALACTTYEEDENAIVIALSEASYADLEAENGRARFSLCHELGHAVLHADTLIRITRIDHSRLPMLRTQTETPAFRSSEWQANVFAGAILVPGPGLVCLEESGRLTPQGIRAMYNVSIQAAEKRIETFSRYRADVVSAW